MKKNITYVLVAIFLLVILVVSGCFGQRSPSSSTDMNIATSVPTQQIQETSPSPVATTENIPTFVLPAYERTASTASVVVSGYVLLSPNASSTEAVSKYNYDYVVRLTIRNEGPDALIIKKAKASFKLGGSVYNIVKDPPDGEDEWFLVRFENKEINFSTRGYTQQFHEITKKTGERNIEFTLNLENNGEYPYAKSNSVAAIIPPLEELSTASNSAATVNKLQFAPATIEIVYRE